MAFERFSSSASSFWLGSDFDTNFKTSGGVDYTKLAAAQRAIANFVNIVTGKNIPVEFQSSESSYTNGKTVVIGTKLDGADFDPAVGLALHEGSHIVHTDFTTLHRFEATVRMHGVDPDMNMTDSDLMIIKDLLNWIEDRRIDYIIYKTAPGYRPYYEAMYDKYFNDRVIDKALREGVKCKETLDDYFFHIINFTNPNRNLDQLELLRDIWNMIDLKNISRLNNTTECLEVACNIYKKLKKHIDEQQGAGQKAPQNSSDQETSEGDETTDGESSNGSDADVPELSERQQKMLDNAMEAQRQFLNGEQTKRGKLSKNQAKTVRAIQEAGTEIVPVKVGGNIIDTVVIKKLTSGIIDSMPQLFDTSYRNQEQAGHVIKGIQLGKMLGRKLQVRNEERSLKTTRLQTGKIDRRLISELGYGNVGVFHKIVTDKYKDYFIHISVDASGSMWGEKFRNSLISAIAIAQAASMTTGIRVQISLRGTASIGSNTEKSVTIIAYDSARDKMSKIRNLFKCLCTFGCTPEGVAFKSIEKQILADAKGAECIFINYSDGYPTHVQGAGYVNPVEYTRRVVNGFKEVGISIISYFITTWDRDITTFKRMYGQDAAAIDPCNMTDVSRSMNKKFLEIAK
jgi:hypothetical protein